MGPKSENSEDNTDIIGRRKDDHIRICLENNVQSRRVSTGFEDLFFVHRALPEIDGNMIDLSTNVFDHKFSAPILIEAISGGTEKAKEINASIAQAIEELGLGMGVGSQRIALENPRMERTFKIARKKAPSAFIMANLGAPQIVKDRNGKNSKKVVDMIQADALAIHLNPLQEAIQPEGETSYAGLLDRIREIVGLLDVPVIIKETGAGISAEDAYNLMEAGVSGIDIGGAGGTSWAAVEYYRAKEYGDTVSQGLGESLWDWGIPTAASIVEVVQSTRLPVIASGGIRLGLDVAKSLSLGADLAGFAAPVLRYSLEGYEHLKRFLLSVIHELKSVFFLIGAKSIEASRKSPIVITGKTAEWLRSRSIDPCTYARRERKS